MDFMFVGHSYEWVQLYDIYGFVDKLNTNNGQEYKSWLTVNFPDWPVRDYFSTQMSWISTLLKVYLSKSCCI